MDAGEGRWSFAAERDLRSAAGWADQECLSQQCAGSRTLAEQNPQGDAGKRLAIGQPIQGNAAAARSGPTTPPAHATACDEQETEEKHALSYRG